MNIDLQELRGYIADMYTDVATLPRGKFHFPTGRPLLEMLGYEKKEEFLKINIEKDLYLRPEDRGKFQKMIERDGYVTNYEVDFKNKRGERVPVTVTSHLRCGPKGQVIGYEGIIVDQTQRKQIEEDYRRLFEHQVCESGRRFS